MNVLIVEDEPLIARFLRRIVGQLDVVNVTEVAFSLDEAYNELLSGVFDVFLVDVCLRDDRWDGLRFCELVREQYPDAVMIILTSLRSLDCLDQAFTIGVNDYMTKPFHPQELRIRLKRWLGASRPSQSMALRYHELEYDSDRHQFLFEGKPLPLSKRNKDLLLVFLQEPERLLSPNYLKERFWGDRSERPRNIRSSLQSLRCRLPKPCARWLRTERGQGYILRKMEK